MENLRDVVIVGGGPVGLWLSCELRLAGLSVTLVERRTHRVNQSRALTIHGRSVEVLSLRGIEDRFVAASKPIKAGHYAVLDTRLDFDIFDSRFPHTLYIPQETTEALIEAHALNLGVEIIRGAVVDEVREAQDRVEIEALVDGERMALAGKYVVGADGARSVVRRKADIAFEGHAATGMWFMGDVRLDAPPPAALFSAFNERGCAMVAPLGDGQHFRIVLNEAVDRGMTRDDPVTFDELLVATQLITGSNFGAKDPLWLSRFDNETRLAAQYRKGRIFLAGDACHIHLPAGGQGMNVGLQDAMNLGWKLAAVVNGQAPEALLDTYELERRPVGIYLHDTTMAQSHMITAFSPHGLALRGVFNDMLKVPEINAYFAFQVSGFGVRYDTALLEGEASSDPLFGVRVRDVGLRLADGLETNLYALMAQGKWVHLALIDGAEAAAPDWLADGSVIKAKGVVTAHGQSLEGVSALLLRPDGYVAKVSRAMPAEARAAAQGVLAPA